MINEEAMTYLLEEWGASVVETIKQANAQPMTLDEFLTHCIACGGNWGGMMLTGIHELWPEVWDAIPDNMGHNAFTCICNALRLLGVEWGD